ncbi:MAG: hypothetical protein IT235_05745 [Bacteroidia bacterium]|nr:hypothetical protein [Bacteroidia bacterium]
MIKNIFTAICIMAFLASCKKSSTSGGGGGGTTTTPINKPGLYGTLIAGESLVDSSTSTSSTLQFYAAFNKYADSVTTDAGNVSCNGFTLSQLFGSGTPYLSFVTGPWVGGNAAWTVPGSGTVSAFNYTCTRSLPSASLPTSSLTVNRTGYTFTCSSVVCDSIKFYISDGNSNETEHTLKYPATSCTFTASELSSLLSGNPSKAFLRVCTYNYESATINGKAYQFIVGRAYDKYKITIN